MEQSGSLGINEHPNFEGSGFHVVLWLLYAEMELFRACGIEVSLYP